MKNKKTLNELRQVKDVVFKRKLDLKKEYKKSINIDELIRKYPNDADLGREVRKLKRKNVRAKRTKKLTLVFHARRDSLPKVRNILIYIPMRIQRALFTVLDIKMRLPHVLV